MTQLSETENNQQWKSVVYFIEERSAATERPNAGNSSALLESCREPQIERFARRGKMQHDFTLVECLL
jgi:hypothetical protein